MKNSSEPKKLADFKVGVDNVIFSLDIRQNRLLVLLIKRIEKMFENHWSLPGTLVRQGESLEASAERILAEKILVNNLYLEQLYTFGGPHRDPREDPTSYGDRYLSVSYFALVRFEDSGLIIRDLNQTAWHDLQNLPALAFDHQEILNYGYRRLRNKLEYSPCLLYTSPSPRD